MTVIPIAIGALLYSQQTIGTVPEEYGNKGTRGDHPNNSIIEIVQNIDRSRGELKRLAVTQSPVQDGQLTLM